MLQTLVPNAREIFRLMAEYQVEEGEPHGLPLPQLFRMCREQFLVSSELTLKSYLGEFRDHDLVTVKKGQDGGDLYCVAMGDDEIRKVLNEMAASRA